MGQTLLHGGKIITVDPHTPEAEAVIVQGERILFVGSDREAAQGASREALRVDLAGRAVVPGFNDNHIHSAIMADNMRQPNLQGLDAEGIIETVRSHFRDAPSGQTLVATGWDYPACPDPHREILDRAFPDNPVVLIQISGHGAWVNSRMLRDLGIDGSTPDPPGGAILRDASGEPTGILRDTAVQPLHQKRILRLHLNRRLLKGRIESALEEFKRVGLTSVQDNSWYPTTVGVLNGLKRQGRLTTRFTCFAFGMIPWMARLIQLWPYDRRWVRRGPWKFFLDGTFSTHSAWLLEPYADEPQNLGESGSSGQIIRSRLRRGVSRCHQSAFHAIGDRTIHEFLNVVEQMQRRRPWLAGSRLRLEHAQLIARRDIPRLRELGVVISAQPHALGAPAKDQALLGKTRAESAYPHRWLLEEGVPLSFGSDMPGEPTFAPLLGIHYVVNRSGPHRLTPMEALRAYTLGSAYAEFMEEQKGSIAPGKLADLVVLGEDLRSAAPERIRDIPVVMTVTGGKVVYRRQEEQERLSAGRRRAAR